MSVQMIWQDFQFICFETGVFYTHTHKITIMLLARATIIRTFKRMTPCDHSQMIQRCGLYLQIIVINVHVFIKCEAEFGISLGSIPNCWKCSSVTCILTTTTNWESLTENHLSCLEKSNIYADLSKSMPILCKEMLLVKYAPKLFPDVDSKIIP